ncbi:MAG: ABC transporter permease, partial [Pseudomonadota bacterium]|nr:ABC transporter permease [Syntrophobacterales bacterium]MDI9556250.1 ABC transporter permease [Pseudomonadota bacterium]
MPYEFFVSLRYLRAKRKQVFVSIITFISMAGILLGVAALIIVLAVMNGFEKELRDKILGINAHIILMEYTGPMKDHGRIQREIASVPGVVASTPFIYSQAMLKNGDSVSGIVMRGLSPADARDVINLGRMLEGRLENLSAQGREALKIPGVLAGVPGIVLGKELARHVGASLFDAVHIVSPQGIATPLGMVPRMKKFVVVGIFESGFYEYDSTLAYTSLADSQEFLGLDDRVTGLEIKVENIYKAREIAGAIEMKLGYPAWARDWMKMNRNLFAALRLEKRVMFIIVGLIVLVAGFNII